MRPGRLALAAHSAPLEVVPLHAMRHLLALKYYFMNTLPAAHFDMRRTGIKKKLIAWHLHIL